MASSHRVKLEAGFSSRSAACARPRFAMQLRRRPWLRNFIYIKRYVSQLSTATWIHFITVHSNTFEKTVLGYVQQIVTPPGARMMATRPSSWKRRRARQLIWWLSRVGLGRVAGCCRPHKGQIFSWFLTGSTTRPNLPGGSGASSQDVARCRKMSQAPVKNTLCYSLLVRLHLPLVLTKYPCDSVYSALLSCWSGGMWSLQ